MVSVNHLESVDRKTLVKHLSNYTFSILFPNHGIAENIKVLEKVFWYFSTTFLFNTHSQAENITLYMAKKQKVLDLNQLMTGEQSKVEEKIKESTEKNFKLDTLS